MRAPTTDFSQKTLHIAVATKPQQWEHEEEPTIHGIIYRPDAVFNKINETSEHLYDELFAPGQIYQIVVIQTEMGPGELGKLLEQKFKIDVCFWVGGIVCTFTTDEVTGAELLTNLAGDPQAYLKSEEKLFYA